MSDAPSTTSPEALVAEFWETLFARDWEHLHDFFGDDSVYWDVPAGPTLAAKGPKGIVARAKSVLDSLAAFENDQIRTVSEGDTVMTEHHEIWRFASGEEIVLPCLSVQVVQDGVITLWKDYWDMQTLMGPAPAEWREALANGDFSWIVDATGSR
ncbi:limonene-1,2-epoxide hydrolase [Frankia sp. CcI49]|uniref:nuclear transport factor 2 family protein n=1 Tax=unclassified Frankia TaxID=2632575 RepID=UPI0006CA2062|nr:MULTISPECIES: nuclear transport factor 2 family protein [unclassified Frankia]KPM56019.1 limonene-1,2-epoxide hydrolase [Frankia sp. R43]ONH52482.1 limonene-1,2-epoxide hydrolase [Frankia sp. CcI49]